MVSTRILPMLMNKADIIFWTLKVVHDIFSWFKMLQEFFSNSSTYPPPPSKVKWSSDQLFYSHITLLVTH